MAIIVETLTLIDDALESYVEDMFALFAGDVAATLQLMAIVSIAIIAINGVLQIAPMTIAAITIWGIRFALLFTLATSWTFFLPIYDLVTNGPARIGAELISLSTVPDLNEAMDSMIVDGFEYSDRVTEEAGTFGFSITGTIIWLIAALMGVFAILLLAMAKVGLALAIALAPVFIPAALFTGTKMLFERWSQFAISFALIPVVVSGVMGVILGVANTILRETPDAAAVDTLSQISAFLMIMMAAIFMMARVPTLTASLAGGIVAVGTGIAEARQAARMSGDVAAAPGRATRRAEAEFRDAANAVGEARAVRRDGGSAVDAIGTLLARRGEIKAMAKKRAAALGEYGYRRGMRDGHRAQIARRAPPDPST